MEEKKEYTEPKAEEIIVSNKDIIVTSGIDLYDPANNPEDISGGGTI